MTASSPVPPFIRSRSPPSYVQGQNYLKAMAAAANFAWVNRQIMTYLVRQAFAKQFNTTADELDMHLVYDVSHNIAKIEEHLVGGTRPSQRRFPTSAAGAQERCHSRLWTAPSAHPS